MELQPLDWGFAGMTALFCTLGLFRGFSGFLAFLTASAATAAAEVWLWPAMADAIPAMWARVAISTAAGVLVFGIVRICVRKAVNGLLAQPVDSIAGLLAGLACSGLIVFAASRFGIATERSVIAREVAGHVW